MNKKLAKLIKQNRSGKKTESAIDKLFLANRFGALVFLLVFFAAGSAFVYQSSARSTKSGSGGDKQAVIFLTPNKQSLQAGSPLEVSVWVNSYDTEVNAVQAVIKYPSDKLGYVSSDSSDSPFTVQAEVSDRDGTLTIARGSLSPVKGQQFVAKVTFKPTQFNGKAQLSFDSSSSLLDSTQHVNILGQRLSGSYEY